MPHYQNPQVLVSLHWWMDANGLPRLPLIEDLTTGPVPAGSNILVEYDPASQWYNASVAIAAGWLKSGGYISYHVAAQPPMNIRLRLKKLGLDVEDLESSGKLTLWDWHTATLGRKSQEKHKVDSLKVADLSIEYAKEVMRWQRGPHLLSIMDNDSCLARFNDVKPWVEFMLTRLIPIAPISESIRLRGIIRDLHSEWVYKNLEVAVDGIVDFKIEDVGGERRNLIGIRSMRNVAFDGRWHQLKVGENFEVTLEK